MKVPKPVAIVAALGLLVPPFLWLLIALANIEHFERRGGILGERYLTDHLLIPAFMLALAGVALALGLCLLWKRANAGALIWWTPAVLFSALLVAAFAYLALPERWSCGDGGGISFFCGFKTSEVRTGSYWVAGAMTCFSLPTWLHISIHDVVQFIRLRRKRPIG